MSLVAAGCGRLPDYALPKVDLVDVAELANRDGVPYRKLTRADFRATAAPIDDPRDAARMGAFTCANVVPQRALQIEVEQPRPAGAFVARPLHASFIATMDRNCSWWNPQQRGEREAYVLQHEQIHFAIVEAAARQQTARIRALSASGDSPDQAVGALQRAIEDVIRDTVEVATRRNTDFDRDTSGRSEPALQQRWYDQLSAELAR